MNYKEYWTTMSLKKPVSSEVSFDSINLTEISYTKYTESLTAPSNPTPGDRWFNLGNGILYTAKNDDISPIWIQMETAGYGLYSNNYTEGLTAPSFPNPGDRWFNLGNGILYTAKNEQDGVIWVQIGQ